MTKPFHRTIALTGGIGSGKSTVASLFEKRGARLIDADQLARQVVMPGAPALGEIQMLFGDAVLRADGSLDRKALARIIFADPEKRAGLEQILHPRINRAFKEQLAAATEAPVTIYVVPLFFESTNPYPEISGVIVVKASRETCLARIMERDQLSAEEAELRLRAQLPIEQKAARADWVITNESTPEALGPQVERIYKELIKS